MHAVNNNNNRRNCRTWQRDNRRMLRTGVCVVYMDDGTGLELEFNVGPSRKTRPKKEHNKSLRRNKQVSRSLKAQRHQVQSGRAVGTVRDTPRVPIEPQPEERSFGINAAGFPEGTEVVYMSCRHGRRVGEYVSGGTIRSSSICLHCPPCIQQNRYTWYRAWYC